MIFNRKVKKEKETENQRRLHWVWLANACGTASKAIPYFMANGLDADDLYFMTEEEIEYIEGIGEGLKVRLCDKKLDAANEIVSLCDENGFQIVTFWDAEYPDRLRKIEDPPAVLYVEGTLPPMNERLCVAMVGTRKMSDYGREMAYRLSYDLAAAGAVVVSGLALGIDGVSACGALSAGGSTVAVLGCGLLHDYPKSHRRLRTEIVAHGAVISEYPPNVPPVSYQFPVRNRIVSGLSQGTLLVEAAIKSGTMITARLAKAQGRALFAVPGKVGDVNSGGANAVIREGAYVVLEPEDLLGKFQWFYSDTLHIDAMEEARKTRPDEAHALKKYGVPAEYVGGRFGTKNAEPKHTTPKKESMTPSVEPKAEVAPKTEPSAPPSALLDTLDATARKVFEHMPIDRPITPDLLVGDGTSVGEVISALTMLEIAGLIRSLPGGMYVRA